MASRVAVMIAAASSPWSTANEETHVQIRSETRDQHWKPALFGIWYLVIGKATFAGIIIATAKAVVLDLFCQS